MSCPSSFWQKCVNLLSSEFLLKFMPRTAFNNSKLLSKTLWIFKFFVWFKCFCVNQILYLTRLATLIWCPAMQTYFLRPKTIWPWKFLTIEKKTFQLTNVDRLQLEKKCFIAVVILRHCSSFSKFYNMFFSLYINVFFSMYISLLSNLANHP